MDRRIGASSAVMRALLRSVVVKRELSLFRVRNVALLQVIKEQGWGLGSSNRNKDCRAAVLGLMDTFIMVLCKSETVGYVNVSGSELLFKLNYFYLSLTYSLSLTLSGRAAISVAGNQFLPFMWKL